MGPGSWIIYFPTGCFWILPAPLFPRDEAIWNTCPRARGGVQERRTCRVAPGCDRHRHRSRRPPGDPAIRRVAQEAPAQTDDELVARSVAARSRPERHLAVGQRVYFYRRERAKRNDATIGAFVGPGCVVAPRGSNSLWSQYGDDGIFWSQRSVRACSVRKRRRCWIIDRSERHCTSYEVLCSAPPYNTETWRGRAR